MDTNSWELIGQVINVTVTSVPEHFDAEWHGDPDPPNILENDKVMFFALNDIIT